ncbi:MAG: acyl carrier protein [Ruminococcus sp.]|nr:acyl carrier protein [Ruminococcus sp.]MCM1381869.1 acyl carrier protein [Muribaculaceae bacterium]MCM1478737.1 acyl carrier protein [Muribaculaceae bacterium]
MFEKIKELICNYVEVNAEDITENSRFIEDLGFNSYDFISMLGDLENELGVTIDETEITEVHTVGEAVKYLNKLKGEKS